MLTKRQTEKYSDVLLWGLKTARKRKFKRNDIVLLRFDPAAIKLAETLHGKLLDMGMHPVLRQGLTPVMEHNFYGKSNNRQIIFLAPGEKELLNSLNGNIYLRAPESLTHLSNIDPMRIGKAVVARKPFREILQKRENRGGIRVDPLHSAHSGIGKTGKTLSETIYRSGHKGLLLRQGRSGSCLEKHLQRCHDHQEMDEQHGCKVFSC